MSKTLKKQKYNCTKSSELNFFRVIFTIFFLFLLKPCFLTNSKLRLNNEGLIKSKFDKLITHQEKKNLNEKIKSMKIKYGPFAIFSLLKTALNTNYTINTKNQNIFINFVDKKSIQKIESLRIPKKISYSNNTLLTISQKNIKPR